MNRKKFSYPKDFKRYNAVSLDDKAIADLVELAQDIDKGQHTSYAASGNIMVVYFRSIKPDEDFVAVCKVLKETR
jgi:hypothetical protein